MSEHASRGSRWVAVCHVGNPQFPNDWGAFGGPKPRASQSLLPRSSHRQLAPYGDCLILRRALYRGSRYERFLHTCLPFRRTGPGVAWGTRTGAPRTLWLPKVWCSNPFRAPSASAMGDAATVCSDACLSLCRTTIAYLAAGVSGVRRRPLPNGARPRSTAAGVPAFSPHDLRHRRVSVLHLARRWTAGKPSLGGKTFIVEVAIRDGEGRRASRRFVLTNPGAGHDLQLAPAEEEPY